MKVPYRPTRVLSVPETDGEKHRGLHGLRGLAALGIVAYHTAYMAELDVPGWLSWVWPDLQYFVHLFFVLSAVSLCMRYQKATDRLGWVADFAIRRFFRISPLFYLMILIWGVVIQDESLLVIITNVIYVFNLLPVTMNSVVPAGWAVGAEMLFYLMFPAMLSHIRTLRDAVGVLGVTAVASIASRILLQMLLPGSGFAIFYIGSNLVFCAAGFVVFRLLQDARFGAADQRWMRPVTIGSAAGLAILPTSQGLGQPDAVAWVVPWGALCLWQCVAPSTILTSRLLQWAADRSFSLYLMHTAAIGLLMVTGGYGLIGAAMPGIAFVACVVVTICVTLPLADLTYRFIEVPGQRMGASIIGWRRDR